MTLYKSSAEPPRAPIILKHKKHSNLNSHRIYSNYSTSDNKITSYNQSKNIIYKALENTMETARNEQKKE